MSKPFRLSFEGKLYQIDATGQVSLVSMVWADGEQVEYFDYYISPATVEQVRTKAKQQARDRANKIRRERDEVRRSMGLKRVRGALGGVYWE